MTPSPRPSPWWSPHVHAGRRPLLEARSRIKSAIRQYLGSNGFTEVEPGCLQVSPGNETHLNAFGTTLVGTDLTRTPLYLHTSPEFACKKLLAAGERRIFAFAPCFRNRERGPLHAPEFMMLEWYRVGAAYVQLFEDCAAFLTIAAQVSGRTEWEHRGRACNVLAGARVTTVEEAFQCHAGVALGETYTVRGTDRDALAARAAAAGIRSADDDTWSDIFSRVLTERIEPKLGAQRPEILCEYPIHEAALARAITGRPHVAERFELYVCGVELANGFGELNDAATLQHNLEAQMSERQRRYGERYPIDEDFIDAVAHMPPSSGCALGFDRLVMLATGAPRVDDVLWTPLPATIGVDQ